VASFKSTLQLQSKNSAKSNEVKF